MRTVRIKHAVEGREPWRAVRSYQGRTPPERHTLNCGLEYCNAGPHHARHRCRIFRADDRLRLRMRPLVRRTAMIFDYSLAGLVTAGLLVYLIYALLKPELF